MENQLRRSYFILLAVPLAGIAALALLSTASLVPLPFLPIIRGAAPAVFMLAALTAFAAPVMYRVRFAHRHRVARRVDKSLFLEFEKGLIRIALLGPYWVMAALALALPRFHLCATVLMALFAAYVHYPSTARIRHEKKMFRVSS